jgi:hypothetical protein
VENVKDDIAAFCPALRRNRKASDEVQIQIKEAILPLAMKASTEEAAHRARQANTHHRIAAVTAYWQDNLRSKNVSMFSMLPGISHPAPSRFSPRERLGLPSHVLWQPARTISKAF